MEDEGSDSTLPSSSSAAPAAPLPPMIQRLLSGEGSALMKGSIPPPSDADGSDLKNSGDTSPKTDGSGGGSTGTSTEGDAPPAGDADDDKLGVLGLAEVSGLAKASGAPASRNASAASANNYLGLSPLLGGGGGDPRGSYDSTTSNSALTGAVLSELASSALEILQQVRALDTPEGPPSSYPPLRAPSRRRRVPR